MYYSYVMHTVVQSSVQSIPSLDGGSADLEFLEEIGDLNTSGRFRDNQFMDG